MLKQLPICWILCCAVALAEPPVQGVKPSNFLGSPEQHASFSFVRPGLTQTSFAFNGPSSHQSFSSTIGNPQLAQRVLPSLAHALAYRNPGLGGFFPIGGSIPNGYASLPHGSALVPSPAAPLPYQAPLDQQATALAYLQQLQHQQQHQLQGYPLLAYQAQLAQLLALRQAQAHPQFPSSQHQLVQSQQVSEAIETPQQEVQAHHQQPQQNLLGVAYSSAPSVAHVKVSGNGYKFDF